MKEIVCLDELAPGERGVVYQLNNDIGMRRRLREIGLVEESEVECLGRSPAKDPAAYLIRGAVIAIRSKDAHGVLVVKSERRSEWD